MKLPRLRRRRRPEVDRAMWPMDYVGPVNRWGLAPGPCRIERKWAGGYIIRTPGGMRSTVAKIHVIKPPA